MVDIRIMTATDSFSDGRAQMRFALSKGRGVTSGIEALLQVVVINLFTDPGTDALAPTRGGGFFKALRTLGSISDKSAVAVRLQATISRVEKQVLEDQDKYALPSTERLASLRLDGVTTDPTLHSVNVAIHITNEAGQSESLAL